MSGGKPRLGIDREGDAQISEALAERTPQARIDILAAAGPGGR